MSNTELINPYSMMSATISSVTFFAFALSKVIVPETFTEHKNLVLGTLGLATSSHVITDNAQIIWIYK